jgi:hypothetical protein
MSANQKPFNIHNEFDSLIRKNGYTTSKQGEVIFNHGTREVAVYIPSIHVKYTKSDIWYVFEFFYGIVTRIDTVSIKTADGKSTKFKSAFVFFSTNLFDFDFSKQIRIIPSRVLNQKNKSRELRMNEFWMLLPNNSTVSYTTLTLDQIEAQINDILVAKVVNNAEESATLTANRQFLVELRNKQNRVTPPYQDTSINVHQLARNLELMETRLRAIVPSVQFDHVPSIARTTTVLIDNLPLDYKEENVWDHFGKFGSVSLVKVMRDPFTRTRTLGYAYVCYYEDGKGEDAAKAIASTFGDCKMTLATIV